MSEDKKSNEQLDNLKRQAGDVIQDMRSRKLLLPAVVLLVAIVAAFIVLPKKSEPVEAVAPPSTPVMAQDGQPRAVQISLLGPSSIGDGAAITSSANPFLGTDDYSCKTISNGDPKVLDCEVADLRVRVTCPMEASEPPCAPEEKTGGAGGASGSTGAGGGSGSGDTSGSGTPDSGTQPPTDVYIYKTDLEFDGKTHKAVEPGGVLPSKSNPVVTYTGVNSSATRGMFQAAEGSTVSGVAVDSTGLTFVLKPNQTAKITIDGHEHKLKLKKISKVKT